MAGDVDRAAAAVPARKWRRDSSDMQAFSPKAQIFLMVR
jgi:hypothetical protein